MVIKKGVSKKLDILVVADPYSMSGKAQKARQYGTRIVAEPVFWRIVGVPIE
jgi:DNA polymerase-3 subunit epsilon